MPPNSVDEEYSDHVHSWEEIKHYVAVNKVNLLKRNREAEIVYRKWTSETIEEYGNIENYMTQKKLLFGQKDYLILGNDFPYSVTPGIEHVLVWSKRPLASDFVESLLNEKYGSCWEWTFFVNPPELQSIRRLPHVHVFMRKVS
ncbi:unnamed protein product [Rhizopus stolonifer]